MFVVYTLVSVGLIRYTQMTSRTRVCTYRDTVFARARAIVTLGQHTAVLEKQSVTLM